MSSLYLLYFIYICLCLICIYYIIILYVILYSYKCFCVYTGANHHDAETLCATEKEIRSKAEPIYLSKESDPQLTFERCAQQCLEQNNP